MHTSRYRIAFRVTVIYLLGAGIWILVSDRTLESLVTVPGWVTNAQTYKGWLFVVVTALLLYLLLRRQLASLEQARTAQERYARRMEILHSIDRGIIEAKSFQQIADTVMKQLRQTIACQRADITVIDPISQEATVFFTDPIHDSEIHSGFRFPAASGWIDELRAGQVIAVEDARLVTGPDNPVRKQLVKEGMLSFLIVPLIVNEQLVGSLKLASNIPSFFTAEHLEVTSEVADQLAITVQQFQLKDELTRRANELEHNVAELKQIGQAYRDSEERYRMLVDHSPYATVVQQDDYIAFANPAALQLMGASQLDELVGKPIRPFLHPDSLLAVQERIGRVLKGESGPYPLEARYVRLDNSVISVEATTTLITFGGRPAIQVIALNITERKRAEEARRQSEERYRFLFENMLNGFAFCQMYFDQDRPVDFKYLEVNSAFETLTGLKNVTGKNVSEIIPGIQESDPELLEIYGRVALSGIPERFEIHLEALDMWFSVSVYSPEKEFFVAVFDVITERKRTEEKIRKLNESLEQRVLERTAQLNQAKDRIEAILNSSSDVIILCKIDGTIDQVNPAFDEIFNSTSEDVRLQPLTLLVAPQHVDALEQAFQAVVQTWQARRIDVTVQYNSSATFDADMVLSPIVERRDRLLGVVCSLRDISAQKQMEVQLRQMLQRELELNELKSGFVSMAAHDLRNPLSVIQSTISLLNEYNDRLNTEQKQTMSNRIQFSIRVMVDMLDDILTIGQAQAGKLKFDPTPLNLVDFCQNIVAEMKPITGSTRQIEFSSGGSCGMMMVDARLLWHILANLLSNAVKYSPEASVITFGVQCEPDQIIFHVKDEGIGIPQADQARLFDAFHRASNAKKMPGTGLGLAIVKLFVELHSGTIAFASEEGHGSVFTVMLPRIDAVDKDD